MRKLLLLLLVLGMSFTAMCQEVTHVNSMSMGTWNTRTKEFDWDDAMDVDLSVTLTKRAITIDNRAHSIFIIKKQSWEKNYSDHYEVGWDVADQQDRNCFFKMVYYKEDKTIQYYVIYSDFAFVYKVDSIR